MGAHCIRIILWWWWYRLPNSCIRETQHESWWRIMSRAASRLTGWRKCVFTLIRRTPTCCSSWVYTWQMRSSTMALSTSASRRSWCRRRSPTDVIWQWLRLSREDLAVLHLVRKFAERAVCVLLYCYGRPRYSWLPAVLFYYCSLLLFFCLISEVPWQPSSPNFATCSIVTQILKFVQKFGDPFPEIWLPKNIKFWRDFGHFSSVQ